MSPSRNIRVLHVDDDSSFLELTRSTLERDFPDLSLETAASVDAGLSRLVDADFDCIVSEYDLPDRSGIELVRTVRERDPDIPIVLLTDTGSEEVAAEAIQAGVDGYLQKNGPEMVDLLGTQLHNLTAAARLESERDEREKELALLNRVTLILFEDGPLRDRLEDLLSAIPDGYRFPDRTAVRIRYDGESIETPTFTESAWMQTTSVGDSAETRVTIEVAYIGEWEREESPFLPQEQALLDAIGNLLRAHLERVELIEQLTRTNDELRTLLDNLPAVIYLKDIDGRYLLVNDEFETRVGKSREEIIGRTPAEIHPDEWAETVIEHDQRAIDRGEPVEFEETVWHDGSPHTYLSVRVPLFDDSGDPYAVYGISTDITEQVELIDEHDRILARMTDAFYALDADWCFTYVNDSAERVLQRAAGELLGKPIWEEFPDAAGTEIQDQFERAMDTQETVEFTTRYDPLDATFEITAYPSESGLSVYFRDVTNEIERERQLETYEMMVETVGDPMYILDRDGTIELANDAMSAFLERSKQEIVGEPVTRFVPEDDVDRGQQLIEDLIERDGERWDAFEMRVFMDDGRERVTENKFGLVEADGDVDAVVGVLRDISERKEYEDQLERQNRRLEQFASVVSHDLRNPLNVAEGYLELAREQHESEHLDRVKTAHDRMRMLIEDLLVLAREGEMITDLEAVAIDGLVRECWETVSTEQATLDVQIDHVVEADRSRLRQVFENLFRNGVEHGGDDVTITVGSLPDGFVIEDDGPGIPADKRDQVFDVGFTTSHEGTGFGLSIVMQIVEAHGWTITLGESAAGGARFEITGVTFRE